MICVKVTYETKAEALRNAGKIRERKNGRHSWPYICSSCGKWHLTSTRTTRHDKDKLTNKQGKRGYRSTED